MISAVFDLWLLTQYIEFLSFILNYLYLSFIFAVLLSITVHFIALRLKRAIMNQHTKILLK